MGSASSAEDLLRSAHHSRRKRFLAFCGFAGVIGLAALPGASGGDLGHSAVVDSSPRGRAESAPSRSAAHVPAPSLTVSSTIPAISADCTHGHTWTLDLRLTSTSITEICSTRTSDWGCDCPGFYDYPLPDGLNAGPLRVTIEDGAVSGNYTFNPFWLGEFYMFDANGAISGKITGSGVAFTFTVNASVDSWWLPAIWTPPGRCQIQYDILGHMQDGRINGSIASMTLHVVSDPTSCVYYEVTEEGDAGYAYVDWQRPPAIALELFDASREDLLPDAPPIAPSELARRFQGSIDLPPKRYGAVTDGSSRLLVRATYPVEAGEPSEAGQFSLRDPGSRMPDDRGRLLTTELGNPGQDLAVQWLRGPDGVWYAWCVYEPPRSFDRGVVDRLTRQRNVRLSASTSGACGTDSIRLLRPPVILVHGLWSKAGETWSAPAWGSQSFHFYKFSHDGNSHFVEGAKRLYTRQREVLRDTRRQAIACNTVDIVGHSMGGLLVRTMLDAFPASQEHVRRFITIGSPHWGSDLANVLMALRCRTATSAERGWLDFAMWISGHAAGKGGVEDLQEGSPAIRKLPACSVPSHTISSQYAGESWPKDLADLIKLVRESLKSVADPARIQSPLYRKVRDTLAGTIKMATMFDNGAHDAIVGACSQTGGAERSSGSNVGYHVDEPSNPKIVAQVLWLLQNEDPDAAFGSLPTPKQVYCDSVNQSTSESECSKSALEEPALVAQGGARTRLVFPDSVFSPGQVVTGTLVGLDGYEPRSVLFVPQFEEAVLDTTPPFTVTMTMPTDKVGTLAVAALASDARDELSMTSFTGALRSSSPVLELEVGPEGISFLYPGMEEQCWVMGRVEGLGWGDLTSGRMGTTYRVLDATVASVDGEGLARAIAPGSTSLVVSHGNLADTLAVEVSQTYGACTLTNGNCFVVANERECTLEGGRFDGYGSRCLETPVLLQEFQAQRVGAGAVVRWEVGPDGVHAAFHLHRESAREGRRRLTFEPLTGRRQYEFVDDSVPEVEVRYWLEIIAPDGTSSWNGPARLDGALSSRGVVSLSASHPNPFVSEAGLTYWLPKRARVKLAIHDVRGRRVATLVDGWEDAGPHSAVWRGTDSGQLPVAAGVYYVRLEAGGQIRSQKIILAR